MCVRIGWSQGRDPRSGNSCGGLAADRALDEIAHQRNLVAVEAQAASSMARFAATTAVASLAGRPRTSSSTDWRRSGRAATPLTTMRMRSTDRCRPRSPPLPTRR